MLCRDCCHTTPASGSDGLSPLLVLDISSGKNTWDPDEKPGGGVSRCGKESEAVHASDPSFIPPHTGPPTGRPSAPVPLYTSIIVSPPAGRVSLTGDVGGRVPGDRLDLPVLIQLNLAA